MREGADRADNDAEHAPPSSRETDAVVYERFNLHATVSLAAEDDLGRERLCRYLTRPAFALERIRVLRDGNVAYRVKKVSRNRITERVMTPIEFLARLAALVAPPRYPLLRFHGVLAPRHAWRQRVVPRPRAARPKCSSKGRLEPDADGGSVGLRTEHELSAKDKDLGLLGPRNERLGAPASGDDGRAAFAIPEPVPTSTLTESASAERVGPNILSIHHWQRLLDGELYAARSRLDWATLLRRTFESDVRVCVRCGGRLSVRAVVTAPASIATFLDALRRERDPPVAA